MKKIVLAALAASAWLYAGPLGFESGVIKAHTEVFGDSTIDPMFTKATSHLSIENTPSTLKGTMEVSVADFVSDNAKRDEHMHEAMESSAFPKASFEIKEVVPKNDAYLLKGTMSLHGVSKPFAFEGTIREESNKVRIKANGTMKMSDYGIKPPKMMFLTVRDQVDLSVDVVLKR